MKPMKPTTQRRPALHLLLAAAIALLLATPIARSGPGAHGPNGEHLDSPTAGHAPAALPRVEAQSETFELVATLHADALSVLIDRFDSNEPVLGATLEVESAGVKAKARFQADHGDYTFDDPKLLAQLRSAGEHGLVFTLVAGKDSDLLDGTLVGPSGRVVAAGKDDHAHDHETERVTWTAAGVAALGLIGGILWRRQRRPVTVKLQGGL